MPDVIALIPTRLQTTALGLPSRVGHRLAGCCVLEHTIGRVARVKEVGRVVLLHGPGQDPMALLENRDFGKPVSGLVDADNLAHPFERQHAAARKWAISAWRGGLGGATCYDELLPARAWLAAMDHHKAVSALLVGADWPLVDPDICRRVLRLHLDYPQDMQMTFAQAPPGLGGIAIGRELVGQLADSHACLGQLIAYNPGKPQADPIGRDVCIQIDPEVRRCPVRFVYDTPPAAAMVDWIAQQMGDQLPQANARSVVDALAGLDDEMACGFARLAQMVTLELTPRRRVHGPVTAQHHVALERPDMCLDTAERIVAQLGQDQCTVLTLGGLGDALLHNDWERVVTAAHKAGVWGVAVETDLLVDQPVLEKLLTLPIEVVSVRLNADTAHTYKTVMDPDVSLGDGFAKVIENLQWLLNQRNSRTRQLLGLADGQPTLPAAAGLPWVITRLVKTAQTLGDLETFFDRWVHYAGHAVIEPATSGCGLAADLSPVRMDPPARFGCRQITRRMTIHSDGRVAQCDQDWLGRGVGGNAATTALAEIWRSMRPLRQAHARGQGGDWELCHACHEWHRP